MAQHLEPCSQVDEPSLPRMSHGDVKSSRVEPGPQYVRLISSDNHTFIVDKKVAQVSGLIRGMMSSGMTAFVWFMIANRAVSTADLCRRLS